MSRIARVSQTVYLKTNFSAGRLDTRMFGRTDTQNYDNGAAELTNFAQQVQGGIRRRPGLQHLLTLNSESEPPDDLSDNARLIPFIFNIDATYIVALWWNKTPSPDATTLSVYKDDGTVCTVTGTLPAYAAADIKYIRWAQRADTMLLCHEDYKTVVLTRTGATTFALTDWAFFDDGQRKRQPYYKFVASGVTLTWNGTVLTDSSGIFDATWNGLELEVYDEVNSYFSNFTLGTYAGPSTQMPATKRTTPTHNTTTATLAWGEPVYSSKRGYFRCPTFHGQRLWFGGTSSLPSHVFSSRSAQFYDFWVDDGSDEDSIQVPVVSDQMNEVMHLTSGRTLTIFTDQKQLYAQESSQYPLIPTKFGTVESSNYGTTHIRPVGMDRAYLYQQPVGTTVRESLWNDITQSYESNAVNLMAVEVCDDFIDMCGSQGSEESPETYLFGVRPDGKLAVMHYLKSENLVGWSFWETRDGDRALSIITIYDEVFCLVRRVFGSDVSYRIEKFTYAETLDASATYTQPLAPGQVFTNAFPHLAGLEVSVTADAEGDGGTEANIYYLGEFTIGPTGTLDLSSLGIDFNTVHAGFNYTATAKTMPVAFMGDEGSVAMRKKRVNTVHVRLMNCLSVKVDDYDFLFRFTGEDLEEPPTRQTDVFKFHRLGWDRDGQITITMDKPFDGLILAVTTEVSW